MAKSITHQTNLFCWRRGFKAEDLGSHPCADDLVLLSMIKDDLGTYISNEDHCWLNGIWGMVYTRKFPLKNKHRQRLEDITIKAQQAITRQTLQLAKIKQQRQAKV